MKTALLHSLERRVEAHLNIVIGAFQNLPPERLLQQAPGGGWSIAQCLEHLNSYGRYYIPRMRQAVNNAPDAEALVFKSSWLGDYFTRLMQPGVHARKMKAPKGHIPPAALDPARVTAEFIAQQEALLLLLRQAEKKDIGKIRIPISISRWIRLKLGDTLGFLVAHNERHLQQAQRVPA